jgi:hypothetical protein
LQVIFTCRKIYDLGPQALLPLWRSVCCWFIALTNPSPWAGLNPLTLGPVVRTLTITPPRRISRPLSGPPLAPIRYNLERFEVM